MSGKSGMSVLLTRLSDFLRVGTASRTAAPLILSRNRYPTILINCQSRRVLSAQGDHLMMDSVSQEEADSPTPTEDLEIALQQTLRASNELKHQVRNCAVTFHPLVGSVHSISFPSLPHLPPNIIAEPDCPEPGGRAVQVDGRSGDRKQVTQHQPFQRGSQIR